MDSVTYFGIFGEVVVFALYLSSHFIVAVGGIPPIYRCLVDPYFI